MSWHIDVSAFQPFESRRGIDTVLALRFGYDRELIDILKTALRSARYRCPGRSAGEWLPEERCWFCERAAWPIVREHLALQGCKFTALETAESIDFLPPPPPTASPR